MEQIQRASRRAVRSGLHSGFEARRVVSLERQLNQFPCVPYLSSYSVICLLHVEIMIKNDEI